MKNEKWLLGLFVLALMSCVSNVYALDKTSTGFYYPIGESNFDTAHGSWLERDPQNGGGYFDGLYHIGVDMMTYDKNPDHESSHVYAIADGNVFYKHCSTESWGHENCALFIRHKTVNGDIFTGLYGHIRTTLDQGDEVLAGRLIGTTGPWDGGIHLHFAIRYGDSITPSPWGRLPNTDWPNTNGFVDPINFLNTHAPYLDLSDDSRTKTFNVRVVNNQYAWYPPNVDCFDAVYWFEILPDRCVQRTRDICFELQGTCPAIQ